MGRSLPRARLPAATALLLALLACSSIHCQEEPVAAAAPAAAAPAAAAPDAAVPDAAVPDAAVQMVSQAGCECLSTWYDAAGIERQGCANPDMDPMGDWCQVNPNTCLGYYGVYTSANGSDVFYDYCSSVREKTVGGCLCAPDWSMGPGATVGKPHYRDRCARPEAPDAKRKCRVDFATCPENSTVGEFDFCDDTPAAAAAAAGESERSGSTTFHNCDCKAGWIYTYADGTKANFSACANPDGDPMGPWCAVDPATCDRFAGEIDGQERNETLGYDYCDNKFRHPEPNSCAAVLQEFDQCGGKSKCSDFGCEDEPWPGACCPQGTRCYRQDSFYYQCLSPYNVQRLKEQQAAAAAAGIAFAGLKPDTTAPLQQQPDQAGLMSQDLLLPEEQQQAVVEEEQEEVLNQEDPASLLPSPAQDASQIPNSAETQTQTQTQAADSADSLIPSPGQAGGSDSWRNSDGLTAPITLSPARQPTKVYTKLKIDMDYDKLVSSPENTARFKSDVVTWLKSSVGNTQNVQDAGVMAIVRGSVVALAYVEFKPDTPAKEIELATSHLRTNADRLYGASSLPSAWGGLVSYLVSPNAAALDGAAMEMVPQQRGKTGKLGSGAIAGIAVALVCAVALSAYVVKRTFGAKRRREAGENASGKLQHSSKHLHQDELDGSVDGNSTYSSNGPADGSTYSSNVSYAASPTKSNKSNKSNMSHGASPTRSAGFGRVGAWSDRSNSKSAEEVAYLDEEAEPVGLVVPASGASNLSTVAVHGSASAGSPQAMAARAATPDAAFLPDECEHTFDDEELDLAKNPVGRLRAMYGQGQGRNSGTGTPVGNRNNGDSYTGSAASFHSLSSRPASGAGAAAGAVLKQRRISSTSRSSDS